MTELSFLIDLLLNHDLQKATKDAVAARIKEVEAKISATSINSFVSKPQTNTSSQLVIPGPQQAPSTLAAMAKHAAAEQGLTYVPEPQEVIVPVPVAQVAQTPAAAAALAARQAAIGASLSGAVDKVHKSPNKFRGNLK